MNEKNGDIVGKVIIGILGMAIGGVSVALFNKNKDDKKNEKIEKLQKQNLKLQEEHKNLQGTLKDILAKYRALKIWTFKHLIIQSKGTEEEKILKLWVLDEYLNLLFKQIDNLDLTKNEEKFLKIIENVINNKYVSIEEREFLKTFVNSKYKENIKLKKEPNLEIKLNKIEVKLKEKVGIKNS